MNLDAWFAGSRMISDEKSQQNLAIPARFMAVITFLSQPLSAFSPTNTKSLQPLNLPAISPAIPSLFSASDL